MSLNKIKKTFYRTVGVCKILPGWTEMSCCGYHPYRDRQYILLLFFGDTEVKTSTNTGSRVQDLEFTGWQDLRACSNSVEHPKRCVNTLFRSCSPWPVSSMYVCVFDDNPVISNPKYSKCVFHTTGCLSICLWVSLHLSTWSFLYNLC